MGGSSEELSYLPNWEIETDWVLVCADGKELPCCGAVLACLSPVLAGLRETKPRADGLTTVPFKFSSALGSTFLYWAHRCHFHRALFASEAKDLAIVSHEWNIAWLAAHCDSILVPHANKPDSLVSESDKSETFELALMAASYGLSETLATCELKLINCFKDVATDNRLAQLDMNSLRRVLMGVFAKYAEERPICHHCTMRYSRNRLPSVEELQDWARQMEVPEPALQLPALKSPY